MALSNRDRVGKAIDLLQAGLCPFIEREMLAVHSESWEEQARQGLRHAPKKTRDWDAAAWLNVLWNQWQLVFRKTLGPAERSLVKELQEARNRWAHQQAFSIDDAYRALDSVERLLTAICADEAAEASRQKQEVLRIRFEQEAKKEQKRASVAPVAGQPTAGLKPWRETVTPHPDVASGRYQQAEFAADLAQVHRGEGSDEYRRPRDFFERTFMTEGLQELLTTGLERLTGKGGAPVVELQTTFGGGKTHSLLALYHAFSGVDATGLAGLEPILERVDVEAFPKAANAVLVGTALAPAKTHEKEDGTVVHTLWGELAWQLGGAEGYKFVAESDKAGTNPGDALRELFARYAPCLILIDEWVAYARQLYDKRGLPAGDFEAHFTFAQALSEAAKGAPKTLLVVSVPASDYELGGEGGREALDRIKHALGRVETPWRPASAEESFEIVRRRLFQPITEPHLFAARDAVVRAFGALYRDQKQEFPQNCGEGDYERRIEAAYPIHPELFDRLYNDWSSLEKFQRTRGVLRLMAAVIHSLWEREDKSLLILPSSAPVDDLKVQRELTRYLEDPWVPVIEADVDGPNSLPLKIDRENPNLGRYSAARRVARAIFLGSAPTLRAAHRGIEDRSVKLACAQPGEAVATFGDALRRLTDQATHLYVDGRRYWYSTQRSVTQLARDRAGQRTEEEVIDEIKDRLRKEHRDVFARVHPVPASSGEVPDEPEARLVILSPDHSHSRGMADSPAMQEAQEYLKSRGASPRNLTNTLVFLAADRTRLEELKQAVRQHLAWKSIDSERDELNLDAFQRNQATTKTEQADEAVRQRIPETYQWLLYPEQAPDGPLVWKDMRLQGQAKSLAARAAKKLTESELLFTELGALRLRMELDRIPLWRGDHVDLKQLAEDFAKYVYLPRLRDVSVLAAAVREGVSQLTWQQDAFAYAEAWDEEKGRYRGLRAGQTLPLGREPRGLLVKPDVAAKQLRAEVPTKPGYEPTPAGSGQGVVANGEGEEQGVAPLPASKAVRFHGTVKLNEARLASHAGQIAEAVVQHLVGLVGSRVEGRLEIHADVPDGTPDNVVRTVTENCRTLKFDGHGFEHT